MTRNPFFNALSASAYILMIVLIIDNGTHRIPHAQTIIIPIAVVSVFTLSAAVMGYIFLYNPAQLYLDGKKKEAVSLFLRTVAVFAVITVVILALLFSGIFGR